MSAALALILLAEAATSCAPAGAPLLPGGATVVRPVGTLEPVPFERLGPATSMPKSDAIQQTAADRESADHETDDPDAEPAAEQCELLPLHIV